MYRAFNASLPDEEKERYSKHPPILVIGGSYLNAKQRMKEYSRYFTVVVIDEYMTSQTCPNCLKRNKEVVKGEHRLRVCIEGCLFQARQF